MKKKYLLILLLLPIVGIMFIPKYYFSKKPTCIHPAGFVNTNDPLSNVYQSDVRKILRSSSPKEFRYFFISFTGSHNEYMMVNMRNDSQCFDARMLVTNWDKLEGMRRTNGLSYPEELYNVTWELKESSESDELVFLDMNSIID